MHERIAVNFARRCLQYPRPDAFREPEHIHRAHYIRFDGFDGIVLVMDGRSRASEIVDLIDLDKYRLGNVVPDDLEISVVTQVSNVCLATGKEIIEADNVVTFAKKAFTKM